MLRKQSNIMDYKTGVNKVLVRLNDFNNSITLSNGLKLFLDYKFRPEVHAQVIGTVVSVPETLLYNKENPNESMPWVTQMELMEGDTVYMEYLAVIIALADRYDFAPSYPNPGWVMIDGQMHILIDYSLIYFALRDDRLIPLNGFCIARPITVTIPMLQFEFIQKDNESSKFAELIHVATPIDEFIDPRHTDYGTYNEGDIVMFHPYANQTVEHTVHQTFNSKDRYVVIQRQWIFAVASNELKSSIMSASIK